MKSYVELDCDNVDVISQKIYQYLSNKELITGWNFLDTKEMLTEISELREFFAKHKLYVRHASATVAVDNQSLPLHLDTLPVIAKVNFPVINTQGWVNRWYAINHDVLSNCPMVRDQFGSLVEDLSEIDEKDMVLVSELADMPKPIVFNSRIPHSVVNLTATEFPRIVASFTFHNEPLEMLR